MQVIGYRPDIDGLRAVAVGSVLIYHAFPSWLPGGFVGVDVFFVISGYLITRILVSEMSRGEFSFFQFSLRRVRRLFPALLLVLAFCICVGWFILLPGEYIQLGKEIFFSSIFAANFYFWSQVGYFSANAYQNPLLHLWSLAVEEQFYLLWPLMVFLCVRIRISLVIMFTLVTAASLYASSIVTLHDPSAAFFLPFTRAWEFGIGAIMAVVGRKPALVPPQLASPASAVGSILLVLSFVAIDETQPFPGLIALLPVAGAGLLIAAGPDAIVNRFFLSRPEMVAIGLISYPLYLWHWPLLSFAYIVEGGMPAPEVRVFALVSSVALAYLTWSLLERRVRRVRAASLFLVASMLFSGVAGAEVWRQEGLPNRASVSPYVSLDDRLRRDMRWDYAENDLCLERYPTEARREGWWFCMLEEDEPVDLILLGNSFANQLYPGLVNAAGMEDVNVLSVGVCDPALGLRFTAYVASHPCHGEKRSRIDEWLHGIFERNESISVAVLWSPWPTFDDDGNSVDYHDPSRIEGRFVRLSPEEAALSSRDAFFLGLEERIAYLVDRDIVPVLLLSTPLLPYDPTSCFARRPLQAASESCEVPLSHELLRQKNFRSGVRDLEERFPELVVIDPLPLFCRDDVCRLKEGEVTHLRDIIHLTAGASAIVGDQVARVLRERRLR